MHQHSVQAGQHRSSEDEAAEHAGPEDQPVRMVPLPGLAVRRRPAQAAGPPTIRRTLVDNSGQAPVHLTTIQQLQAYPWWNTLSGPQQDHLEALLDPEYDHPVTGPVDLQQALTTLPRRAVTGGVDFVNEDSWDLIAQLVDQYTDVVCADPALNFGKVTAFRNQSGLDFGAVQRVIQQAAPGARNADIFIIHPGPWITEINSLHLNLRTVMTPGCVAYVLTDNEGGTGGGQADLLLQGLNHLGGFTVTVRTLVPDPKGMLTLGTGLANRPLTLKPYHDGGFRLIRIAA
ncbi:MAG: hypothetical protein JO144_02275 [Actinobacteria bacterium]|nr:hypothetical protein [Actinomycetota bacterium]